MHESILINIGNKIHLPLACISVCLSRGLSVFLFVSNVDQETLIRKMFPMVSFIDFIKILTKLMIPIKSVPTSKQVKKIKNIYCRQRINSKINTLHRL